MMQYITQNLAAVQAELAAALGDNAKDCRMLAAVKYAAPGEIEALLDAGIRDVGENRVQQLLENAPIYATRDVRVHFIGTLQTNKVKYIADKVDMIHSLDSEKLAKEIEKRAAACGRVIDVLVEINVAREPAKTGVMPEDAEALCRAALACPHLHLCGFMTMGPV
ncbi:MAG: YggS family pyridoxal phosphate-dependent enzyme, partial [Clostridia bacterium]|nr:YggS family pyridoxal phosphate-dependent enzyme [Clostridia bacterium]